VSCLANSCPDGSEILKPAVGRRFVAHAAPDPLLGIQAWLVTRQVVEAETGMGLQEPLDLLPSMPAGPVHIEPDRVARQSAMEMPEGLQEPGSIAAGRFHHAVATQEGGHPPREIEPLPMLTGGGDPQALPPFRPAPAHAGVQGEPGLILEDDGLLRVQLREFFLAPAESAGLR